MAAPIRIDQITPNGNVVQPYIPTSVWNGKVTVATAGSRVQLISVSTPIRSITVKALASNTGLIYVGNTLVSSSNGHQLSAGNSVSLDINDLSKIYIDCGTNGDGVTYLAVN